MKTMTMDGRLVLALMLLYFWHECAGQFGEDACSICKCKRTGSNAQDVDCGNINPPLTVLPPGLPEDTRML